MISKYQCTAAHWAIPGSRFGIFSPINADRFSNQSPIQVSNPDRWQSDNEIQRKISGFNEAIKILLNEGYITKIRKKKEKYYISDMNKAIQTLENHGYITLDGL